MSGIRMFSWKRRTEAASPARLEPLLKRRIFLSFDWNYSKIPVEAAKKQYAATVEEAIRLKGEWLVLALETPVNTTEGGFASKVLVASRTVGRSLDELLRFGPEDDLEVTVAMPRNKRENQSRDVLQSRDIEYLGVGFLKAEGAQSPTA